MGRAKRIKSSGIWQPKLEQPEISPQIILEEPQGEGLSFVPFNNHILLDKIPSLNSIWPCPPLGVYYPLLGSWLSLYLPHGILVVC